MLSKIITLSILTLSLLITLPLVAQKDLKNHKYISQLPEEMQRLAINKANSYCNCLEDLEIDPKQMLKNFKELSKQMDVVNKALDANKLDKAKALFEQLDDDANQMMDEGKDLGFIFLTLENCNREKNKGMSDEERDLLKETDLEIDKMMRVATDGLEGEARAEKQREILKEFYKFCPKMRDLIKVIFHLDSFEEKQEILLKKYGKIMDKENKKSNE